VVANLHYRTATFVFAGAGEEFAILTHPAAVTRGGGLTGVHQRQRHGNGRSWPGDNTAADRQDGGRHLKCLRICAHVTAATAVNEDWFRVTWSLSILTVEQSRCIGSLVVTVQRKARAGTTLSSILPDLAGVRFDDRHKLGAAGEEESASTRDFGAGRSMVSIRQGRQLLFRINDSNFRCSREISVTEHQRLRASHPLWIIWIETLNCLRYANQTRTQSKQLLSKCLGVVGLDGAVVLAGKAFNMSGDRAQLRGTLPEESAQTWPRGREATVNYDATHSRY
jgi:hypothetical protein